MPEIPDGEIQLDSEAGKELGFTSNRFGSGSYLWRREGAIIISYIESNKRGNFRELVERILSLGFPIHIPTPLGRMQEIVRKNGYRQTFPYVEYAGECIEVWVLDAVLVACKRQLANIERWLKTGVPASPSESKSIYDQMKASVERAEGE